jgi:hypothetical protein
MCLNHSSNKGREEEGGKGRDGHAGLRPSDSNTLQKKLFAPPPPPPPQLQQTRGGTSTKRRLYCLDTSLSTPALGAACKTHSHIDKHQHAVDIQKESWNHVVRYKREEGATAPRSMYSLWHEREGYIWQLTSLTSSSAATCLLVRVGRWWVGRSALLLHHVAASDRGGG